VAHIKTNHQPSTSQSAKMSTENKTQSNQQQQQTIQQQQQTIQQQPNLDKARLCFQTEDGKLIDATTLMAYLNANHYALALGSTAPVTVLAAEQKHAIAPVPVAVAAPVPATAAVPVGSATAVAAPVPAAVAAALVTIPLPALSRKVQIFDSLMSDSYKIVAELAQHHRGTVYGGFVRDAIFGDASKLRDMDIWFRSTDDVAFIAALKRMFTATDLSLLTSKDAGVYPQGFRRTKIGLTLRARTPQVADGQLVSTAPMYLNIDIIVHDSPPVNDFITNGLGATYDRKTDTWTLKSMLDGFSTAELISLHEAKQTYIYDSYLAKLDSAPARAVVYGRCMRLIERGFSFLGVYESTSTLRLVKKEIKLKWW